MADRTESIIIDFEIDMADSVESIETLTKANKNLREERKKLDTQSVEGKKRIQEINTVLDQNNQKIKANVSALEQQKINVGNYKSALDGVHPALGKVGAGLESGAGGFKAMTLQALRFLATGVGAALAALVTVFTLLKTAITSNNELFDKFENITNAIGVVVEVVTNRIGKLGEALIALASGNFSEAIDLTGQAFGGLAAEIEGAVEEGQKLLDLSRELEDGQRDLTVAQAKQENVIKALVVASKNRNLSLDEQEGKLRHALRLEEELIRERERLALLDLEITAGNIANTEKISRAAEESLEDFANRLRRMSTLGDDQVNPLIEKLVALEHARGGSLAFQEKVENSLTAIAEKKAAALEKINAALAEQAELERANRRSQENVNTETQNPIADAFETEAKVMTDINKRLNDDLVKRNEEKNRQIIQDNKKAVQIQNEIERAKLQFAADTLTTISGLFRAESEEGKLLASASAVINTYLAATAALASGSEINPIFGALAAANAIITGLAAVAKINEVEFAEGGWTGPGHKMKAVGVVHANEYVTPSWLVNSKQAQPHLAALEGMRRRGYQDGGLVSNSITQPINQQQDILNFMKHMPNPQVEVVEIRKGLKRVAVREKLSKR